ncbi:transposase [Xanthomonas citri pv. aurantifolii str. ICPB 11122]|nr:transposase [Xanthomonas citri pv. aurantifolii str. ICPB 11122]
MALLGLHCIFEAIAAVLINAERVIHFQHVLLLVRRVASGGDSASLQFNVASGELVFHIFGAIAQFERRLMVERTLSPKARRLGRAFGDNCELARSSACRQA